MMGATALTTYELYKKIASILAQNNSEALFDYIIHSMDNNGGFLRSRYCYWNKVLPDSNCGNISTVLLSLNHPFDFNASTDYYENDPYSPDLFTKLKMQLFLYDLSDEKSFMEEAEWSAAVGFSYPIKIHLAEEKAEILPPVINTIKKRPMRRDKKLSDFLQKD